MWNLHQMRKRTTVHKLRSLVIQYILVCSFIIPLLTLLSLGVPSMPLSLPIGVQIVPPPPMGPPPIGGPPPPMGGPPPQFIGGPRPPLFNHQPPPPIGVPPMSVTPGPYGIPPPGPSVHAIGLPPMGPPFQPGLPPPVRFFSYFYCCILDYGYTTAILCSEQTSGISWIGWL